MAKKNALGRGIGALIEGSDELTVRKPATSILEIDIDKIDKNPWQPRSQFDVEQLNELAASIKELGIIQPLTLRKIDEERYQIIAGERRFKAAQAAGLKSVPAYIRLAEDEIMLELALVENIQRTDLNPIDIAFSYQRMIDEFDKTQEEISERVGKKRSTVANYLRLLKLPAEIQLGLRDGKISMGHAKAIINIDELDTQIDIYKQIVENDLSVRAVEELVRNLDKREVQEPQEEEPIEEKTSVKTDDNKDYEKLREQLSGFFQTNIQFTRSLKGNGKIVIPFKSDEDLEKIVAILDKINS